MGYIEDINNNKYENDCYTKEFIDINPYGLHTNRYDDYYRIIEETGDINKNRLLDIGAGDGKMVYYLSDFFNEVYATEVSSKAIEIAKHKTKDKTNISFYETIIGEEELNNWGKFDLISCCAVLEHVIDPYELVNKIEKLLNVGGYLLLTVPNIAYIKHRINLLFGNLPLTGIEEFNISEWKNVGWDGGHFHYFTKLTLSKLLEKAQPKMLN